MFFIWLLFIALISMLALGLLPDAFCRRYTPLLIGVMRLQALLVGASVLGILFWCFRQTLPLDISLIDQGTNQWGFYLDGLSLTMLTLVAFMTGVVGQFSVRYLDGEAAQGRFIKWLSVTAAAVMCFILSNHLLLFMGAWMLSSLGLHQLLTHYSDRAQALLAARKKFVVSRLGDLFLLGAFALIYQSLGSWNYTPLFEYRHGAGGSDTPGLFFAGGRGHDKVCAVSPSQLVA